jgi:hypothetical protein
VKSKKIKNQLLPHYLTPGKIERKRPYLMWKLRYELSKYTIGLLEEAFYQLVVKRTPLPKSPLFILGHHRSGTTYLQKLISQNAQFVTPNLFDTVFPDMMVLGQKTIRPILNFFCNRLKINMELHNHMLHMDFPGEEDVAMLGQLNPYAFNWALMYPKDAELIMDNTINNIQENLEATDYWKKDFIKLIKKLQFLHPGKELLLKSPPHMGRLKTLLGIFPEAKFIYIMRDPYTLYPSMKNFWKINERYAFQGFPEDKFQNLISPTSKALFDGYFRYKSLIPKENLIEIKYEDFKKSPISYLEKIHTSYPQYKMNSKNYEELLTSQASRKEIKERIVSDIDKSIVEKIWVRELKYHREL